MRKVRVRRHLGYLLQKLEEHSAQVLHSHFGDIAWEDMGAARRAHVGHVVTFYGYDVNRLPQIEPQWRQRYLDLFEHIDCVLCEGSHMAQQIVARGCPPAKARVHHLGVAVSRIPFRPRTWDRSRPLRVLIAATFREKKGIPIALEVLGRMRKRLPLEITIIGDANAEERSQAEKRAIYATVERYGLAPQLRMLGYQPHSVFLEEAYGHDVFFSPSITAKDGDTEGGAPVSIIEAAATGMPVVSTLHCDIPEVLPGGLLAREGDLDGLIEKFEQLVDLSGQWLPMLAKARCHIEREYDVALQAQKLAAIYEEVAP